MVEFPNELKHVDVTPVHKKRINVIKLTIGQWVYFQTFYEKIIYNQIYEYFNEDQCRFVKGYSSQNSLLIMTEKFTEPAIRRVI